jgi:cytochrome P450
LSTAVRGLESWRWYWRLYRDPMSCLMEAHRRFGAISVFENPVPGPRHGLRYMLVVGAALNRDLLGRTDFQPSGQVLKGPRGSAQQRIRHGLLKMHGEEHRTHRRAMQPPFGKSAVMSTVPLMAPLIDEMIDRWRVGEPLDVLDEMRTLSNWLAANVLFGNEDFANSRRIGELIDRWVDLDAATRRWGGVERDLPGSPYRRELRHAEILEATMREMIERKRRAGATNADVMSMLIRAADSGGSGMTDDAVIAHSITLYGASFETTTSALTWTLFLLAQHPQCAARLHDEVSSQLTDWPPTSQTLDSMTYLDAVIRESMRLMPPVPVSFRRVTRPSEFAGMQVRTGDKVGLSHFLTHRDPAVFPDPQRFDPARWFKSKPDPYQYIPFSAGARLCIGSVFAMTELKLVIARIVQKYRMATIPGTRIDPVVHLVLKPRRGLPMIPHLQDRSFTRVPVTGNILKYIDLVSPEAPEEAPAAAQPLPRRSPSARGDDPRPVRSAETAPPQQAARAGQQ